MRSNEPMSYSTQHYEKTWNREILLRAHSHTDPMGLQEVVISLVYFFIFGRWVLVFSFH